jgi:DUF4097 and DUF4098 domain-containing protein YvlB
VLLALASAVAMTTVQQIDTTMSVAQGQRLQVNAFGGDVSVQSWNRNAVRVQSNGSGGVRVQVSVSGPVVSVRTEGRRGPPREANLTINTPPWMAMTVVGVHTDVTIAGTRAPVTVETVEGEVDVSGGDGLISLRSVQGEVSLRSAKGRIKLNSVNEDVAVANSSGEVMAETVNGEITLDRVDAATLDASTVNGDIAYDGPIRSSGRYALSTHNGDITLTVAEATSASVIVSTFNGEFESEFPVPLSGTRKGKGFNFTLGAGSAQVSLDSFQGTIRLVRPGSREIERNRDRHREHDED